MKKKDLLNQKGFVLIGIVIIVIIAVIVLAFWSVRKENNSISIDMKNSIKNAIVQAGLDKEKIIRIMPGDDWVSGPSYKVDYDNDLLFVYVYDNGDIVSIRDSKLNYIYENPNAQQIKEEDTNKSNNVISLNYNELGEYGKEDQYGNEVSIRYYIPEGTYNVKALTRNAQFFIEKVKIYKNSNGYYESETVKHIQLKEIGSEESINIKSDECIFLTINSNISLEKQ